MVAWHCRWCCVWSVLFVDRVWAGGGGVVFEFCIVDASIFGIVSRSSHVWGGGGVVSFLFVVLWFVCVLQCMRTVFVCVASCEGRMVDALALRADEGRWSLR